MAKGTYDILRNSVDGLPPVPWELLEPLVKKYIAEKNPQKKQGILDNIYWLADNYSK